MAKMEPKTNPFAPVEEVKEEVKQEAKEPTNVAEMQAILDRLDKLEKENAELKKWQMNVFTQWKEKYDWPRAYCYKLWWWVPVLSFKPFLKDPTKDLVYKDQFWQWKSNHYLKLTLANGKEEEVEVNDFNKFRTLSEKVIAEKRTDNKWNLQWFAFETEEWWEIIVEPNIINE